MYLIDTDVISEARKGRRANEGVRDFFADVNTHNIPIFLSVVTIGELRRGVDLVRKRGDLEQSNLLENWLSDLLDSYRERILDIDCDTAQVWGRLRVPNHENALDKLIAATALIHDLTVVTHNESHFSSTNVRVLNPFLK